jgi:hypothetical protein
MPDCAPLGASTLHASGLDFGPLFTVREILRDGAGPPGDAQAGMALASMASYVASFLTAPHPDLGRGGAVCPFAARAAEQDLIRLTACSVRVQDPDAVARIVQGIARLRSELEAPDDVAPADRALIAVFPALTEPHGARMIEQIQRRLKLSFVQRRLMIGQFFPSCPEPGLWNDDFRPLQSPVISLAIRNITIFDAPFMLERQEYVDAFVRTFGLAGEERIARAAQARGTPGRGGSSCEVGRAAGDSAS